MSELPQRKCFATDTWAGRTHYPVDILGSTPKKHRIRLLGANAAVLPGGKRLYPGETTLIPQDAIFDWPAAMPWPCDLKSLEVRSTSST